MVHYQVTPTGARGARPDSGEASNITKNQKVIEEIQGDISEQLHYLLEEGLDYEGIILFLESEKLHWIALHTYDTLKSVGWIKPLEQV